MCWVGVRLAHDHVRRHTCFIANDSERVLIDPGSPPTNDGTLAEQRAITDLGAIRWFGEVLSRPNVQVVSERLANALIRHDGHGFSTFLVEQQGLCLPLAGDRHPVLLRAVRRLCPRQQRAGEASGGRLTVSLG